ncbi:hypothetical protein CALVIDRAFT_384235 [Calocera viscosa TUFC12733]|uniref:Phosphatidylinositol N-acetylglucosaminyltransferase subunit H conserved domain-containing protein n=1 Tax=Calocera viscosa (strain TUFC12733) TaxID=1330018 RepID=A0A167Q7Z0_CALVF|nr:hypothetical protein CALVIDRAFT_384235 [Calocera viscosa TUFC12733]
MDRLRVTRHSNDIVEYTVLHTHQPSLTNAAVTIGLFGITFWLSRIIILEWIQWPLLLLSISYAFVTLTHPVSQTISVIPPHGIQLSSCTVLRRRVDTFLPSHSISDILINEGFHRFNIRYYLAVIVRSGRPEEPMKIIIPFSDVKPTFKILREVYHAAREATFEEYSESSRSDPTATSELPQVGIEEL